MHVIEIEFYLEKLKNRYLSHPLGDLGVTYDTIRYDTTILRVLKSRQVGSLVYRTAP